MSIDDARGVIANAIDGAVFPGGTVEVGGSSGALWIDAFGRLTFDRESPVVSPLTLYDLASLTKVIATTTVIMRIVEANQASLEDRLADIFAEWRGEDRERVTARDLLEHASGLAARFVDQPPVGRREFEHDICTMPLEYAPRTRSVYSDLGFILLGFLLEQRGSATFAEQFRSIWPDPELTFTLPANQRSAAAPTKPLDDDARRGRTLVGEVHDNYAAALGGVAGHAGLFGTASAVGRFARTVLQAARGSSDTPSPLSPQRLREFTTRSTVPGSSRALGWDTMLPTSSCGTRMSRDAFGHVGYTGTSLWIDPLRDRYFVLLTNRACGGGTIDRMRAVRRAFHDAVDL